MEHARVFLAIVLSFLVFFLWEVFFVDREPVRPPATPPADVTEPKAPPSAPAEVPERPAPVEIAEPESRSPETAVPAEPDDGTRTARTITVETPLYTVRVDERGAVFTHFLLKEYRESVEEDAPQKELIPEGVEGTLWMGIGGGAGPERADALFSADTPGDVVILENGTRAVSFAWTSPRGDISVEKTFTFSAGTYLIGMTTRVLNRSDTPLTGELSFALTGRPDEENQAYYAFEGPSALINNSLEQIEPKEVEEKGVQSGRIEWTAFEKQYFMTALVPEGSGEGRIHLVRRPDGVIENRYIPPADPVPPGGDRRLAFHLYLGPKSYKVLSGYDNALDRVIDFGWFDIIAKLCLRFMNFLYGIIPNYGIAIIILTVLIKVILWPLGNKGYKSMNEMKKLQPEMARLREKYKDDKKKMNEELMALYRTYKINPMGGCLPMILQIPVFIALYRMLYGAIELRHAPFFGWINDLSAPDRLFRFDVEYVPLMQPPYGIPVLTIIMGATMFFQQKMTPPPGDPTQAKMMTFLPIVFTFIFINFPSGLVLYWLVNNVLSIAQQYYISKKQS